MMLTRVTVCSVERPSPSFARFELGAAELADFGVDGPLYDQRIKLILPGAEGLPDLRPEHWWKDFSALPAERRGAVRTYTIAEVRGSGGDTRIVIDVVLHPGAHGPGSTWAAGATVGDELMIVVPRRGVVSGGIEFDPGGARRLLLLGDETALPAIAQILRDSPADASGTVFVEVPLAADIAELTAPLGFEITWLPRGDRPVGEPLVEAVGAHLGFARSAPAPEADVDPDVWETPTYSSSGEAVGEARTTDDRYAWIAGEARMVTTLRRHLVGELGMQRAHVAFMGYWREGVAMRT